MKPLVSIIMPTYKRNTIMLDRAIQSVLNQTYENWELIVVDDNGIDSKFAYCNANFMKKYDKNTNIRYIQHKINKGANSARNTGILASQGELIAFLDSDDKWINSKLEIVVNRYNEDNESYVFYSSYYIVEKENTYLDDKDKIHGDIFLKEIFRDHVSPTSAVVFKRECFERVGGFDEKLPARQDYDMWLRISRYYKFHYIDKPLVYVYRDGHDSISSNYMNHVKGTEIVLEKIYTYLNEEELNIYKKDIEKSQYNYLSLVCSRHSDYKLAKKYCKKALNSEFNFKSLIILFLSTFPAILRIIRNIRRKIKFS